MTKAHTKGFGLVKRCRVEEEPMVITVGAVTVTITRLGTQTATVSVKAPKEVPIEFQEGTPIHDSVEQAIESVVREGDDNA